MASTSATLSLTSSSTLIDSKAPRQHSGVSSLQCTSLPSIHSSMEQSQNRQQTLKTTAYCRKLGRNVITMATGDAAAETVSTETPEIVKKIQEKWEKVEDKYAVTLIAVAGAVALWGSSGMISAIDRLPLVPGILELVGIGYTGWFAYKNLVFKPEREALLEKVKASYNDIIGSSN
ncbi:Curvature thylakoid 1b protein [Thalictrum thalictroides]|uniref:Curvature thylakoid 1b protein n=1 Tax=Thalictrum thalictroides TaxID=46969 RepID=A0A7J6WYH3_THATH|nr:Curvature thylakoid 1b protein [Thalictrum thalictroides]